jgi:hypothetical protein
MRERKDAYRFWLEKLREGNHLEDPRWIILKWTFKKWVGI